MTKYAAGKKGRTQKSLGAPDPATAAGGQIPVIDDGTYLRPSARGQRRAAKALQRKWDKAKGKQT